MPCKSNKFQTMVNEYCLKVDTGMIILIQEYLNRALIVCVNSVALIWGFVPMVNRCQYMVPMMQLMLDQEYMHML